MTLSCRRICRNYSRQINKSTAKTEARGEAEERPLHKGHLQISCDLFCAVLVATRAKGKVAAGGKGEEGDYKNKTCLLPYAI